MWSSFEADWSSLSKSFSPHESSSPFSGFEGSPTVVGLAEEVGSSEPLHGLHRALLMKEYLLKRHQFLFRLHVNIPLLHPQAFSIPLLSKNPSLTSSAASSTRSSSSDSFEFHSFLLFHRSRFLRHCLALLLGRCPNHPEPALRWRSSGHLKYRIEDACRLIQHIHVYSK